MNKPLSDITVLVVGDVMLDQYYEGNVNRISPEAPVPIVHVKNVRNVPGGAANVVNNLAGLGVPSILVGAVGRDGNRDLLVELLKLDRCDFVPVEKKAQTTTKIRVVGAHQQVVRLDFEDAGDIDAGTIDEILRSVRGKIDKADIVVISDYGKGLCTPTLCSEIILEAKKRGMKVVVDPKGTQWDKYSGAFLVTPNMKELSDVAGRPVTNENGAVEKAGAEMLGKYGIDNLLVTRSDKGMTLTGAGGMLHIPTVARDVFDVSGAGDTVVATLSAMLAAGAGLEKAVRLANRAAGVVVGKFGTAPILHDELFEKDIDDYDNKFIGLESFAVIHKSLRDAKKKIVFTNGCFDILHRGHLRYLREARSLGDILIIGLNSDDSVRRLKGEGRPVNSLSDRAYMLSALPFVDYVIPFGEDTPRDLIGAIRPDVLVKGGDYREEDIVGREFSGRTVTIPFVEGYSTTSILERGK